MQEPLPVLNVNQFGAGLSNGLLWILFGVALIFFGFMSVLLMYHWKKYEIKSKPAWLFITAYFIVSVIILITMLVSLLTYINA